MLNFEQENIIACNTYTKLNKIFIMADYQLITCIKNILFSKWLMVKNIYFF
jgi:hypothetical protein